MIKYLFLAFTLIPFAELFLLIKVGVSFGFWPTMGLVLLTGVAGAWLAREQGFSTMLKVREAMAQGRMPAEEMVDAMLIFGAGVVLLTPGFITDALGLALLIPVTRNQFKRFVRKRFEAAKERGTITVQAAVIRPEHSPFKPEPKDITPDSEKRRLNS